MDKQYTISEKKVNMLYSAVSDRILDARIEIARLTNSKFISSPEIDNVMYRLQTECSQIAIGLFKKNKHG